MYLQTAPAIAAPIAPPNFVQSARLAITTARSSCGTEACVETRVPTTEKAPPRAMRIWVQARATLLKSRGTREGLGKGLWG